jgi:hypothetical protein
MTARVEKLSKLKPPQAELALGVGCTYLDDLGENRLAAVPLLLLLEMVKMLGKMGLAQIIKKKAS